MVFNVNSNGFVIVAADDTVTPILGYSTEGNFDPNNVPQNVAKWIEGYKNEIQSIIEQSIQPTTDIKENWKRLKNGNSVNTTSQFKSNDTSKIMLGVAPLIKTKWDQSPYYNALCPIDAQANEQTVTGCVATAMAQVMKYWNYPATGSGFHSYNHSKYGTLSANYGNTTYQWSSMPNSVNSTNTAVAKLMYDVGVSVDMGYGIGSTGGSSAYVISSQSPLTNCSEYALKTYFGYKNTLQGVQRVNYNDTQWLNLLKMEFNGGRPIIYAGFGAGGGHCFAADGFDNSDFIHFNWGWAGRYDGYFRINALNPDGLGTGGGSGGYNSGHQAIIGIEPPSSAITFNLALNNNLTPSATTINYGNLFSVSTNIKNNGTNTFAGDYTVAIFDSNNNFVDYVETKTNYSLPGGNTYTNNLVFSNAGLFSMLPGTYTLGLYFKATGGDWKIVQNSGSFSNFTKISVVNPNSVKLNSAMVVSPSTTLTQGLNASVNLNILNSGTATFIGQYKVGLYNLDGTFVQDIGTYNESSGLPTDYTYNAPYLKFTSAITANPGSYLIALQHKSSTGDWELTGSTSTFLNPINVTVIKAPFLADVYEDNDTFVKSYSLPLTFSGNTATVNTVGSNAHIGTDVDYYKLQLPNGYNYTIIPRLQDSYSSDDGKTYTLDALFSYSTDGITWSEAYDDVIPGNITKNNGGTIYLKTAPYFQGNAGSYLLNLNIARTVALGINQNEFANSIKVYPIPATDFVTINTNNFVGKLNTIDLVNIQGQKIFTYDIDNKSNIFNLPVSNFSEGTYFLQFHTANEIATKKIIISK
ncbi:thiol protease/hemagglutinin PrtT [Flavobacterium sp.]|uniref:thiol protease/hemagglutinin PrtT n=1 Tax=Flavobacterium sp. TaxID=239 RepID=UPI00286DE307|nr:thiol protease/hemagglutinin PrtT [Flavobacterium sp.]